MSDQIATTSTATSSPTPPPLTTPAAPAPQSAPPRAGVIADNAYDRLDPAEQAKYARVRKGPDGGSEWMARDKLPVEPAGGTKPGSTPAPGEKVKIGDYELTASDVATILQTKAAMDLKATQVPATAEAYEARLPETFRLPEGMAWQFDTSSPAFVDARNWAHSQGLTQQQFSQMLSFHASTQIAEHNAIANAAKQELAKLGPNATQRVSAIEAFIRGIVGDRLGAGLRQMILTEAHVLGWEALMKRTSTQGHAPFGQHGREPAGQPGRVSEEAYAKMSHAERMDYARGFDQRQFQTGR